MWQTVLQEALFVDDAVVVVVVVVDVVVDVDVVFMWLFSSVFTFIFNFQFQILRKTVLHEARVHPDPPLHPHEGGP